MVRIGVDFGGVLAIPDHVVRHAHPIDGGDDDGGEGDHVNSVIDMPCAKESLQRLKFQGHSLHLISYCGRKRAIATLKSLKDEKLDSLFDTIHFVRSRDFKGPLCLCLGIQIMIDDRTDVLKEVTRTTDGKTAVLQFTGCDDQAWKRILQQLEKIIPTLPPASLPPPLDYSQISKILHQIE